MGAITGMPTSLPCASSWCLRPSTISRRALHSIRCLGGRAQRSASARARRRHHGHRRRWIRPEPEGEAALATAISEAKLRGCKLVVVNSHRGGNEFDQDKARAADGDLETVRQTLDASGVDYDIRQLVRGFEPAEDLISLAEANSAELLVIGLRRRSPSAS
jgi:nucleotide-binding universal stress UspA family protein